MAEKTTDPPPQPLIPNLPNDISLQCIARIPRPHHPYLSLISKSFHSTLHSPEFFATRCLLNSTQQSLYLNIRVNSSFKWYTLNQQTHLVKTPNFLSPLANIKKQPIGSCFAVLGFKIYVIGGSVNEIASNDVWVFDCRFGKWEIGAKMRVCREFAAAGVVNGRIYVMGGCVGDNFVKSSNWAEVYDPGVGVWKAVESPVEVRDKWMHASCVLDGRIYAMADRGGVVYNVGNGEWRRSVPKRLDLGWRGRAAVAGGVMYCYDFLGKIRGYDVERDRWKELRGVERSLPKFLCGATMASLNGNLCVVWERKGGKNEVEIICAEIEVGKDEDGGLSGVVLWSDVVLRVPFGSSVVHCLSVDL
ncbi:F-box/kelch-repeat protein SKIP6-like isoform X2 [Apium graveolens]|uniref:F-box/kelch-repeat protein SKIP6-like isoform X2 n=1 Tax=Apium graveolens TaxID=4045 RepID=UPI003D7B411B